MLVDIPLVKRKSGDQEYQPQKIVESLLRETELDLITAQEIGIEVTKFIVSNSLKIVTAPLIREIINVCLLKKGYEKARLQYTRVGFPMFDLAKVLESPHLYAQEIVQHVVQEYEAVKKLIEEVEGK